MKRLFFVSALLLASACIQSSSVPPLVPSPPPPLSPAEEVVSILVGKLFSGDFQDASELMLTPPNVSPSEFWRSRPAGNESGSRLDLFAEGARDLTAWLSSCTVDGSGDDNDTARRVRASGYNALEARLVVLNCIPSPGLAATLGSSRVVNINGTWRVVTAMSIRKGGELIELPKGHLELSVSDIANQSFALGVNFDTGIEFNLTDLSVSVDGNGVGDIGRLKSGDFSSGETVRIDVRPMTLHPGSRLRFLHRPSNKTIEFVANPSPTTPPFAPSSPPFSPPGVLSSQSISSPAEAIVSRFIGKLFSGDLRGTSDLILAPPNVSPDEFWKSRFDSLSMALLNQTAWLSSCAVNGSSDDRDTARRIEGVGYRVQEARLVALDCTPSPGLAAPPGVSRVVKINDTWKIVTPIAINEGFELLQLPEGRLGLEVSNVTNRSFVLGVRFDQGMTVNLTDLTILVDGKEVPDVGRFKSGALSFGETVPMDIRPMALQPGSRLQFLHRPSNQTAEFMVNPQ